MPDAYFDNMKLTAASNPMFDLSAMFDSFKEIEGVGNENRDSFFHDGK